MKCKSWLKIQFLTVPKNILEKHLYHFSLLQRIFLVKALWICFFLGVIQLKVVFRDLCEYLQKMQLSSEKQTDWDGPVHLPESPSASLWQCKEKAKTCSVGYLHLTTLWQTIGNSTVQCRFLYNPMQALFLFHPCFVWTSGTRCLVSKLWRGQMWAGLCLLPYGRIAACLCCLFLSHQPLNDREAVTVSWM